MSYKQNLYIHNIEKIAHTAEWTDKTIRTTSKNVPQNKIILPFIGGSRRNEIKKKSKKV